LKPTVRVGEAALREVAAYLLDHEHFARVPATVMVKVSAAGSPRLGLAEGRGVCPWLQLRVAGSSGPGPRLASRVCRVESRATCTHSDLRALRQMVSRALATDLRALRQMVSRALATDLRALRQMVSRALATDLRALRQMVHPVFHMAAPAAAAPETAPSGSLGSDMSTAGYLASPTAPRAKLGSLQARLAAARRCPCCLHGQCMRAFMVRVGPPAWLTTCLADHPVK